MLTPTKYPPVIQIKVPTITHIVDRYIPDINIINPMKKKTDHLFRYNHLLLKSYHKKNEPKARLVTLNA